ncbi:asparagine synthase (glutamine-hydrolyzing) [Polaribacter uvawellassae]|uniref:asparagine synthase (glutamine-hydrolyzing) n=1 Tax=Polaribacter uvawellassae TaxID=3133495 RepID=UPI00321B8066
MCGVVGFVKNEKIVSTNITQLLDSIKHRGPDAQTFFEDETVVLGHTRLSIVDIKEGGQPVVFENLVLIFNGEIYNYKTLRKELELLNYKFATNSDTEVLLKAYHCYGNGFVDKLRGMFSFIIYDKINKELTLARDYFGIKPLYIYLQKDNFYFSSEMMSLIQLLKENELTFNINKEAQIEYLSKGFISKSNIVDNAFELEKGKLFKYKNKKLYIERDINYYENNKGEDLETVLSKEIKEQLNADVEVGVLLSGGIDSSIVTALACSIQKNVSSYSVSFEDESTYDESKYSDFVANKFKTKHHKFLFTEKVLLSYLPKLIDTMDIPIYDPAMLPMLFLCENVSKTSKVVLSGDGGDELFAGYTHHRVLKYKKLFKLVNLILKKVKLFKNVSLVIDNILKENRSFESSIDFDQNIGLNYQLLRKTDLCSMKYGLEVRVPFLSKRVYNFSKNKKPASYINLKYGKLPLRKLVSKLINNDIAYKRKQGFRVPIREWVVSGELGNEIHKDLTNSLLIEEDVLNSNQLSLFLSNKNKYYKELFSLYLLNNWLKKVKE